MSDSDQIQNSTTPQQIGRTVEPPAISGQKEHEPISVSKSESVKQVEPQPEITPSTPEVMIPQELKNTIEKGSDAYEPKIEKNMPEVKLAKESMPVITAPTGMISLPMTYKEAKKKELNSPFSDSIHWFAALIVCQWRKYNAGNMKN